MFGHFYALTLASRLGPFCFGADMSVPRRNMTFCTIRSGCGRARSTEKDHSQPAPATCMPSARKALAAAMPRWRGRPSFLVFGLPAANETSCCSSSVTSSWSWVKPGNRQSDPQAFRIILGLGEALDIVGRIAIGGRGAKPGPVARSISSKPRRKRGIHCG